MVTPRPEILLDESELKRARLSDVDPRYYAPNVCKVAVLVLKVGLTDFVVLSWKILQDKVLVLAMREASFGGNGIEAVAVPVLFGKKIIAISIRPHLYRFHF